MTKTSLLKFAAEESLPPDWSLLDQDTCDFLYDECRGIPGNCICRDLAFSLALDGEDVNELL